MENGRVTQHGTIDEIRAAPRTSYAAELVGVNLFTGHLDRAREGVATLHAGGGEIMVACSPDADTGDVRALLRPADVILYREQPAPGSARNVLRGPVRSLADNGERVRVRIDSIPPVVADVTSGSARRLGLAEGIDVWAVFKAVEVRLLSS
jgi:molybdate transport system ATP-binding protein